MADNLELALKVKADVQQALSQLDKLERELKQQQPAADQAAKANERLGKSLDKVGNEARESGNAMRGQVALYRQAAGALGIYLGAAQAIQALRIADHFTQLQARVRNATAAAGDFNAVWGELNDLANSTGSRVDDTVSLFEGINRAAPEIGATRDQVLTVVSAVQRLGVISGASGSAMSNAMLQFSQAMAGGIVRAEELNSIIENTPAIAQAIADGMNLGTVGALRNAVLEGRVLSKDVFAALESQSDSIAKRIDEMPGSMGRAGQAFANSMGRIITELGKATGLTALITNAIDGWAEAAGIAAKGLEDFNSAGDESALVAKQRERLELYKRQRAVQQEIVELNRQASAFPGDPVIPKRIEEAEKRLASFRGQIDIVDLELRMLNQRASEAAESEGKKGGTASTDTGVSNTLAKGIAAQGKANAEIQGLVKQRQSLVNQLDALSAKLSGPADPAEASTSANVLTLNRLRDTAQSKLDQGDVQGSLNDLERAKNILDNLSESGEVSKGYLQRQIELVRKLAEEAKDVEIKAPVDVDADKDKDLRERQYKAIKKELEKDGLKIPVELDLADGEKVTSLQLGALLKVLRERKLSLPVELAIGDSDEAREQQYQALRQTLEARKITIPVGLSLGEDGATPELIDGLLQLFEDKRIALPVALDLEAGAAERAQQLETLRREFEGRGISVPVALGLDETAIQRTQQYAQLQKEFAAQNAGKFSIKPEVDASQGKARLSAALSELQATASANPIIVEMIVRQSGGMGTPININIGGQTLEARTTGGPVTPEIVDALERAALQGGD